MKKNTVTKIAQFSIPIICDKDKIKEAQDASQANTQGLDEALANGFKLFSTNTVVFNDICYVVYVLTKEV